MTHTYLLEIGLEEMPAKIISNAAIQLKDIVSTHLKDNELNYSSIDVWSTPRRLAVTVNGLDTRQADRLETVKGPAKRIALEDDGNWSKAAIGFTKGQKASVEDIVFKEVKGEEYVFVEKEIKGESAQQVLKRLGSQLSSLSFPVSMKWGNFSYKFIRPVHWLVSLLDDDVVPMDLFDVSAGRKTEGHRFLGQTITLNRAADYVEALKQEHVSVDRAERKQTIIEQIQRMCQENNWQDPTDNEALVNEVTDLVEWPTVFYGSFDKDYLEVPEIVLETAMADHQRYFPVREAGKGSSFLPYFIAVRNGNDKGLDHVRKGNEKVLDARLADAAFFYEEDKKHDIDFFVEKLKHVSFHEKIGSLYEKQERIERLSQFLAPYFELTLGENQELKRAAHICKFDLVTQTVTEFTSLQGEVAGIFARERKETPNVSKALAEQYLPQSLEGKLPESKIGAIISLADKMDSLMSFFAIGLVPTGSNDPFALRRQAMGIVRIIEAFSIPLAVTDWIDDIVNETQDVETKALYEQNKANVSRFILDRLDLWLSKYAELEKAFDVRKAVLHASHDELIALIDQAKVLNKEKQSEQFKPVVESLTRVANLAEKADLNVSVNTELFESDSERALYDAGITMQMQNDNNTSAKEKWQQFVQLHPLIDAFFDENMVMTDDKAVKDNRLALLRQIDQLAKPFAQFKALVIK
ncbi:glycine--tRNA ligase subunit beta [Alkalibacterium kapii]|uniref:Glycine--tRNA ligase beta subunit n=1 Tax=Alkalibacterium kapii TaxID=426704 RepID=A0A511AYH2_9LACT|nr:glycine--tRNA ligase subunit beta [Alkalibacterium kapii]GEK90657.1 glycine--tRNA ligase beta subunit [Alkalibacterium kapii]